MAFTYAGRYAETALKTDGSLAKGTTVNVYLTGGTTPATLYTDRTKGTTTTNPVTTDGTTGQLSFYVDPGLYDLIGTGVSVIAVEVGPDASEFVTGAQVNAASGVQGLDASKRIVAQAAAVTAAAGANNGTTPPAPVVTTTTDQSGTITFGSGATPAAGAQVAVTFSGVWGSAPKTVVVSPSNDATQQLGLWAAKPTTSGFTLSTHTAPTASQANTTYSFSYVVIG